MESTQRGKPSKKYLQECLDRAHGATLAGKELSDIIAWDLSQRIKKLVKYLNNQKS